MAVEEECDCQCHASRLSSPRVGPPRSSPAVARFLRRVAQLQFDREGHVRMGTALPLFSYVGVYTWN
jgi:hypothetical protein